MTALRLMAAAALLGACATTPPSAGERAGGTEGTVRVAGSAPMDVHVLVEPEGEDAVRIVGARRDEIRRLSGARVVVYGTAGDSDHPIATRQIDASDYEIVSVNGEPVLQGVVQGKTAGWTVLLTRDGRTIYLTSVPDTVRTGQTVWVQGQQGLIVQSFGVLKD